MKLFPLAFLLWAFSAQAQPPAVIQSVHADNDTPLNTNPDAPFWHEARPISAQSDPNGKTLPEYRTEVRSRWTRDNIYFLFVCPYRQLYLKPQPDVAHETYGLWNWNVAEVFIGTDFNDIQRYKEFEVSPQNEWVDLDIDLNKPHHEEGWTWNSGFEHVVRIDESKHTWYAAVRIPFAALSPRAEAPGTRFRVNFYRTEGPPQNSTEIMWQPVMSKTFHVPERFGLLQLVAK
jgi:hypothetical protein